jgi:hypothetical protein
MGLLDRRPRPDATRAAGERRSWRTRRHALLAPLVAVGFAGCGNDGNFLGPANVANVDRPLAVFALTGSPQALPAAYKFTTESLVRPQLLNSGTLNFDLAFDIGADGRVRLLPAGVVAPAPPLGAPVVRMQQSRVPYAAITRAPTGGYVTDSTFTGVAGDAFVLQLPGSGCFLGDPFYAKVGIDAVDVASRRITITVLVNRNCGYRSLRPGLPAD